MLSRIAAFSQPQRVSFGMFHDNPEYDSDNVTRGEVKAMIREAKDDMFVKTQKMIDKSIDAEMNFQERKKSHPEMFGPDIEGSDYRVGKML